MQKSLIPTAVAALVVAAALLYIKLDSGPDEPAPPPADAAPAAKARPAVPDPPRATNPPSSPGQPAATASEDHSRHLRELPEPQQSPHDPGSADHAGWQTKRIAELQDLVWLPGRETTLILTGELRNPDPMIRRAALGAIVNQGNDETIPYLRAVSWESDDPVFQQELEKTIEYLEIPPLEDVLSGKRKGEPVDHDEFPPLPETAPVGGR